MILNIYYNDFQHMGMSQMFTGAGDYFRPSKPHSGTLCGVMVEAINTYGSVLTVQVVGAGVVESGCQKAGERWLGTLAGEHLDSVDRKAVHLPSSNHDLVLKFNTTSQAENINK